MGLMEGAVVGLALPSVIVTRTKPHSTYRCSMQSQGDTVSGVAIQRLRHDQLALASRSAINGRYDYKQLAIVSLSAISRYDYAQLVIASLSAINDGYNHFAI